MIAEIYIPDRIFEGYGPNPQGPPGAGGGRGGAMQGTRGTRGQPDSSPSIGGTNSQVAIEAGEGGGCGSRGARSPSDGPGALPAAVAVVNPNREDDLSGQGHLCAAGVVFLSIVRTARLLREAGHDAGPDLLSLLDLGWRWRPSAMSCRSPASIAPSWSRACRAHRQMTNPGAGGCCPHRAHRRAAECVSSRLSDRSAHSCGRSGSVMQLSAAACSRPTIRVEAQTIAETLDRLNQERQAMEQSMLAEAREEVGGGTRLVQPGRPSS